MELSRKKTSKTFDVLASAHRNAGQPCTSNPLACSVLLQLTLGAAALAAASSDSGDPGFPTPVDRGASTRNLLTRAPLATLESLPPSAKLLPTELVALSSEVPAAGSTPGTRRLRKSGVESNAYLRQMCLGSVVEARCVWVEAAFRGRFPRKTRSDAFR